MHVIFEPEPEDGDHIMTYNFVSPPNRFKPREFHILASTTLMSDRA